MTNDQVSLLAVGIAIVSVVGLLIAVGISRRRYRRAAEKHHQVVEEVLDGWDIPHDHPHRRAAEAALRLYPPPVGIAIARWILETESRTP